MVSRYPPIYVSFTLHGLIAFLPFVSSEVSDQPVPP